MSEFKMPSVALVLVFNFMINTYVFMLYCNLEDFNFNNSTNEVSNRKQSGLSFTIQKRINLFESFLSLIGLIIIGKKIHSYFKNVMKFTTMGCIFMLLFYDAVFDIPIAIHFMQTRVPNILQNIWLQVGGIVLLLDFLFKVAALMLMRSFLAGMISAINPLAIDDSSEQGILLDDNLSLPPYDECVQMGDSSMSMPPPYSEICKDETATA